jgi:hypothetical protein
MIHELSFLPYPFSFFLFIFLLFFYPLGLGYQLNGQVGEYRMQNTLYLYIYNKNEVKILTQLFTLLIQLLLSL